MTGNATVSDGAVKHSVPQHREDAFARMLARRVREAVSAGEKPGDVATHVSQEKFALAQVLSSETFREAMAEAFQRAVAAEQPNPDYHVTLDEARREVTSILKNRAADARHYVELLKDPNYLQSAIAQFEGKPVDATTFTLPDAKQEEIIRRLVQPDDKDGAEPAVHVAASAYGQRLVHAALARLFAEPAIEQLLAQQWKEHLPTLSEAQAAQLASEWLNARKGPAEAVAQGLKESGDLYRAAMARSEALQKKKLGEAPLQVVQTPAAASIVGATALSVQGLAAAATPEKPITKVDQRERDKTTQQKAEDIMYTLNHAITCLSITDTIIAPTVGALSERFLNKRIDLCGGDHPGHIHKPGEKHDHGHSGGLNHLFGDKKEPTRHTFKAEAVEAPETEKKRGLLRIAGDWLIGEAVGDITAVVPTILMQRFTPWAMDGMRAVLEPLTGWMFRGGAKRASESWADKQGLARDHEAVVARARELYEYEMHHLPQMAVWTVASVLINFGVMKLLNKELDWGTFLRGKALGAGTTAGLVFGMRAAAPDLAHGWDQTAGKHVVAPITRGVGKLFGIDDKAIDDFQRKRDQMDNPNWAGKEAAKKEAAALAQPTR